MKVVTMDRAKRALSASRPHLRRRCQSDQDISREEKRSTVRLYRTGCHLEQTKHNPARSQTTQSVCDGSGQKHAFLRSVLKLVGSPTTIGLVILVGILLLLMAFLGTISKGKLSDSVALKNRGDDKEERGHYKEAIADYDRSIAADPEYGMAYFARARARYALKDYQGAIDDNSKTISIDSHDAMAYYNRALAKYMNDDWAAAILDYSSSIQRDPDYADAYYGRALAKCKIRECAAAILDYSSAIERNPNFSDAYYGRGNVKVALKEYEGAIADFTAALRINTQFTGAFYCRGFAKEKLGDLSGAREDYRQALNLDPGKPVPALLKSTQH